MPKRSLKLKRGDVRYVSAGYLCANGNKVYLHRGAKFHDTRNDVYLKGKANREIPAVMIWREAKGKLFCQRPPAGYQLLKATPVIRGYGLAVTFVDDEDLPEEFSTK